MRFQSTPAIAGGRTRNMGWTPKGRWCFNPRPPLLAGEPTVKSDAGRSQRVSIHARHCWRANPALGAAVSAETCGFNPRPPLLAGEPPQFDGMDFEQDAVSIHARHCWRANQRGHQLPKRQSTVSIHARHCWRANRGHAAPCLLYQPFQSTPAIAGGRTGSVSAVICWHGMFQSTPAIAGGRTRLNF